MVNVSPVPLAAAPPLLVGVPPEVKSRYLALQQESDFALWRAREANAGIRQMVAAHLRGEGPAPAAGDLDAAAALDQDAEAKYRELRAFLREQFG